jgi:hypothetical protein
MLLVRYLEPQARSALPKFTSGLAASVLAAGRSGPASLQPAHSATWRLRAASSGCRSGRVGRAAGLRERIHSRAASFLPTSRGASVPCVPRTGNRVLLLLDAQGSLHQGSGHVSRFPELLRRDARTRCPPLSSPRARLTAEPRAVARRAEPRRRYAAPCHSRQSDCQSPLLGLARHLIQGAGPRPLAGSSMSSAQYRATDDWHCVVMTRAISATVARRSRPPVGATDRSTSRFSRTLLTTRLRVKEFAPQQEKGGSPRPRRPPRVRVPRPRWRASRSSPVFVSGGRAAGRQPPGLGRARRSILRRPSWASPAPATSSRAPCGPQPIRRKRRSKAPFGGGGEKGGAGAAAPR